MVIYHFQHLQRLHYEASNIQWPCTSPFPQKACLDTDTDGLSKYGKLEFSQLKKTFRVPDIWFKWECSVQISHNLNAWIHIRIIFPLVTIHSGFDLAKSILVLRLLEHWVYNHITKHIKLMKCKEMANSFWISKFGVIRIGNWNRTSSRTGHSPSVLFNSLLETVFFTNPVWNGLSDSVLAIN